VEGFNSGVKGFMAFADSDAILRKFMAGSSPAAKHTTYCLTTNSPLFHPPAMSKLFNCQVSRYFCRYSVPMEKKKT
jgi:hypothetical protein